MVLYFDTAHSDSYRKELVALFDKLDSGELTEGPELAELITNIHKRRYGTRFVKVHPADVDVKIMKEYEKT